MFYEHVRMDVRPVWTMKKKLGTAPKLISCFGLIPWHKCGPSTRLVMTFCNNESVLTEGIAWFIIFENWNMRKISAN